MTQFMRDPKNVSSLTISCITELFWNISRGGRPVRRDGASLLSYSAQCKYENVFVIYWGNLSETGLFLWAIKAETWDIRCKGGKLLFRHFFQHQTLKFAVNPHFSRRHTEAEVLPVSRRFCLACSAVTFPLPVLRNPKETHSSSWPRKYKKDPRGTLMDFLCKKKNIVHFLLFLFFLWLYHENTVKETQAGETQGWRLSQDRIRKDERLRHNITSDSCRT